MEPGFDIDAMHRLVEGVLGTQPLNFLLVTGVQTVHSQNTISQDFFSLIILWQFNRPWAQLKTLCY